MAPMKKAALSTDLSPRPAEGAWSAARQWPLWIALVGLVAGALLLRVWTIRQVLPFVDHPDEPNPIDYVIGMLRTGDPNQHFFQKPSLYVYTLLAAIQAHYAWGRATGLYGDIAHMLVTTHTVTTLPGFFLTARLVTATFAALTVLSAYALGVRGWGRGAGLAGALLVAVLPMHVRFSQWATTDVMASFLASLSLGAALLVLRTGRWQAYLVAGAFAGLAASAKYNAGAVAGAVVVAGALRAWEDRKPLREALLLAGSGLAAIACFIAGTPYALLSWGQVGGGIARQWTNYGGANGHYRGAWNIAGYADFFLNDGLGLAGCLLVAAGLVIIGLRRPRVLLVWLGFVLPSLLVHLSRATHFMQNMLPLLVVCALPAGVAVTELPRAVAGRAPALRQLALAALLAALVLPPLARSLEDVGRQAAGDSRLQFLSWVDTSVPPGSRIAAELKPVPGPSEARWTDVPDLMAHDLAWYRAQGYAYLVASSKRWGQIEPPAAYAPLLEHVVAEFGPRLRREEMTGPRLLVVDTGLTAAAVPLPLAQDVRVGGARLLGVAVGDPSADGEPPMLAPTAELKAGGVLGLRTFWQVEEPFAQDYFIFVHLID
ncbi:MAG: phospholipid carrier-dependent glycosyltransferase, partial [Chloroflexales bacterium]|nr:phospholipid carrier-dependent glycosyltransferase [Chloroflexales bacterium]